MSKMTFNRKRMPISPEYRPMFKIMQLLLILYISSRGNKSSLIRLHLINWVLKEKSRQEGLLNMVGQNGVVQFSVWGVDPALNLALEFAQAEELIDLSDGAYSLSAKGKSFVKKIIENDEDIGDVEFLTSLGKGLTEKMVLEIVGSWQ